MASERAHIQVPVGKVDLRSVIDSQVRGPLKGPVEKGDLPPERLINAVLENHKEILSEVALPEATVEELRRRISYRRRSLTMQVFVVLSSVIALILGVLNLDWESPEWGSGFALIIVAWAFLAFGTLIIRYRPRSSKKDGRSDASGSPSSSSRSPLPLDQQLKAAEGDYRDALEKAIQRWVTEEINQQLGPIYGAELPDLSPEGLGEIDNVENEILVESRTDLESLIRHLPGGSIGLSGPRGVGKTTLLDRITRQSRREHPDEVRAAIVVDAPVEFDPRDFVLHLFARLCESVLDPGRIDALRNWGSGVGPSSIGPARSNRFRLPFPPYLGPLVFAIGTLAYLSLLSAQGKLSPQAWEQWAIVLMALGGTLTYASLLAALPRSQFLLRMLRRRVFRREEDVIGFKAESYLRQIWFQKTLSSGWSGAVKAPIGVEVGVERGTQFAENRLSYPDVVAQYKGFIRELAREGQVRIGIDELDKMNDEDARRFLNEIKVIFRISRCFYLISVSEDAMAYFERRGLPIRDVFDSSFDDVMRVDYFRYEDSKRLLRRRVVGLPAQFIALAHILGGGLARDVIRAAREICELPAGTSLKAVTEGLCAEQLASKCAAGRIAVRKLEDPAQVMLLSHWLTSIESTFGKAKALLYYCRDFEEDFVARLGSSPAGDEEALKQHREALSIGLELVSFAYFIATLQELMVTLGTQEAAEGAIDGGAVDGLAEARQAFAINPAEAWATISGVRRSRSPEEELLPFPTLQAHLATP